MKLCKSYIVVALLAHVLGAVGFFIDPRMEDGEYIIEIPEDETSEPLVKRWEPLKKRGGFPVRLPPQRAPPPPKPFYGLQKRRGTGQMSFIYDEDTKRVEEVQADLYHDGTLPLQNPRTRCHHGSHYPTLYYSMNPDDYRASKQSFFNWCEVYGFRKGHVELSLKGSVAVYVCQKKVVMVGPNRCSEGEYLAAEALMNETCGELKPGKVFMKAWNKEYGRSFKGSHICGTFGDYLVLPGVSENAGFGDEYRVKPSKETLAKMKDDEGGSSLAVKDHDKSFNGTVEQEGEVDEKEARLEEEQAWD